MSAFDRQFVKVAEGISLEVRHYRGGDNTPVLCIPGLTRNAADFEEIAPFIAESSARSVYAISLRGRALSSYDANYKNYHPLTYRDDVIELLSHLSISEAIFLGTSLGGIVTMLVNHVDDSLVKAAILNDIGPDLAPEGIARIVGYVAGSPPPPAVSLQEAADRIRAINEVAFPGRDDAFWTDFAARTFREENGQWRLDYDPSMAKAFAEAPPAPELWEPFKSLRETPTMLIQGSISDLLTTDIVEKMREVHPALLHVKIPETGHAPTLSEPAAQSALLEFLKDR